MTNWPRGGYAAGDTPASDLKPPPDALVSKAEQPKYTESELRVLTEAALRLGRKEAGEEIATAVLEMLGSPAGPVAAHIARRVASEGFRDATSGRTDPEEGA